jgi:hypothetical protein
LWAIIRVPTLLDFASTPVAVHRVGACDQASLMILPGTR